MFYWAIRALAEQNIMSKGRGSAAVTNGNKNAKYEPAAPGAPAKRAKCEVGAIASMTTTNPVISEIQTETGAFWALRRRGSVALVEVKVLSGVGAAVATEGVEDAQRHLRKAWNFGRVLILRYCSIRGLGIPRLVPCERLCET